MVSVMSILPLNELPALFPHVVDWISYLEKQAPIVRPRFQRSKFAPETLQAWIARRLVLRVLHDQVSGSQRCRDGRTTHPASDRSDCICFERNGRSPGNRVHSKGL